MHNISMAQALSVWTDLCASRASGHVVKIYLYRFMPDDPTAAAHASAANETNTTLREAHYERLRRAHVSLVSLLEHFESTECATIVVDGMSLATYRADLLSRPARDDARHRARVQVSERSTGDAKDAEVG